MNRIFAIFALLAATGAAIADEAKPPIRANSVQECLELQCTELSIYPYEVDNLNGIETLASLEGLSVLSISSSKITDISMIDSLKNLEFLNLSSGTIEVPSLLGEADQVPIRKLVCNGHELSIELVRDRGLFSSSYRLSHTVKHNDEDLTFSAELIENEAGGQWGLHDAYIEPGELNPEIDVNRTVDILSCIEAPQICLANP